LKKLLITGGSGDLGSVLSQKAVAAGYDVTATYVTRPQRIKAGKPLQLDLTERNAVQQALDTVQPDVIIHTAVNMVNPRQQIVTGAYHLSKLSPKNTQIIFISTDMIFDGTKAPYRDDDPPSPLSAYGQAKAEMEMMADHVARTSLIYDFVAGNKQVDWMLEKISKGELCKLFTDEVRSPIWVVNLAEALIEMINLPLKGILNIAGPRRMSRLELGQGLLETLGYEPTKYVEETSQAGTGRAPDLTLDVSKSQMLLKTPLLSFEEARARWFSEVTGK
jgi:dTDP-4-dehydrorhamnose reductase